MLVIEGKIGKSLVLQQKLKEWNKQETLVIDSVGILQLLENVKIINTKDSIEDIIFSIVREEINIIIINKCKRIVLSVNCDKSYISDIWKLEQELMEIYAFREFVVTVQNNNLEEIEIYEV